MTSANTRDETAPPEIVVCSFGYLRDGQAPPAHLVLDVRDLVSAPLTEPMHPLTGLDPLVREHVLGARGATDLLTELESAALTIDQLVGPDTPVTVAIGSASGRYRAPALARELGRRLEQAGYGTLVLHHHLDPKRGPVDDREELLAAVLHAARAAELDGTVTITDLQPLLSQLGRELPWMLGAVRSLVDQGLLARVHGARPRTYRVVRALHRIVWAETMYGAGTDLAALKDAAELMFRERNAAGDQFYTEWQRRDGSWSLVAIDADQDEDEDGAASAWHSGLRIETVDVDQPGALAAGQPAADSKPFIVTQFFDGGGTNEYNATGQLQAEALVESGARNGVPTLAALDFIAAEKC